MKRSQLFNAAVFCVNYENLIALFRTIIDRTNDKRCSVG